VCIAIGSCNRQLVAYQLANHQLVNRQLANRQLTVSSVIDSSGSNDFSSFWHQQQR
jgi:hypothetical protein